MIYYFFLCFYYAYSQIAVTLDQNSHQQRYQQTSNNNTYAFYIDKAQPYYLIEIKIVSQMKGEVAFLYQEGSAPSKDQNGDMTYDWMDYNGYMLRKSYQYLVIYTDETTEGQKQYVTVLSTLDINYVLSINGSQDEPCPNNCNNLGKCQVKLISLCQQGYCYCNYGWIDEDCSTQATQVGVGQAIQISNPSLSKTYAYYENNGSGKQLEITISVSINIYIQTNTLDDISIQILIPNLVYLPSDKYNDASVNISKDTPYHALILQDNNDEGYMPEDLIISIQQQQNTDIFGDVTIQIVESKLKDSKTITIIASVLSIVIALTLLLIIYMCFCRNTQNKQNPIIPIRKSDPMGDKELILMNQFEVLPQLDNEQECTICLDPLNNGKEIRRTPCKYIYLIKIVTFFILNAFKSGFNLSIVIVLIVEKIQKQNNQNNLLLEPRKYSFNQMPITSPPEQFILYISMLFIILFQFLQANTQNNIQITDDGYQEIDVFQHERNKTYYSQTQTINCSYFYIQIDIQSFNVKTEVLLLTKNKIAPYFDSKKQINSDQMDMNSNLLNKNYRHLLLKTVSDTYITILINRPLKYNLTITPSNDLMCPKNCFQNGICYNAICQCHSGFIDEDCSQPAQEIFTDTQVTITNPQYLYVLQLNQSNLWKLTASTTNPLGIMIYFLYRIQKISIPTPQIYDDFKQINQQDSVMLNVDTNNQNKLILLIEQLGNKQDFEITIIIQKYKIEKEDSLVEYTMYGLGSLVILVVFLLLVRYILKKLNDKRQYELRLQSIKIVNIYEIPENSQEECTICKSQFDAQSLIRRTICKYELQKFSHFFHSSCLLEWLKYNNTCPMCRKQGIF